jgi:galactokinase
VSSSSALVVASLLASAQANGFTEKMTRAELGEFGRSCELYIGTMSGGMDQAASAMGQANFALRIDFEPLKVRHGVFLGGWRKGGGEGRIAALRAFLHASAKCLPVTN